MASFISTIIYFLLFNGLVWITIGNELPTRCSGSIHLTCYPVIPSFVQFYGWNLQNIEKINLYNGYGLKWSLQTLPSGLFNYASNIKYIFMNDVGLENLKCEIFQPLRNSLMNIRMEYNLFREFPSCALKNLNQLKYIYFTNQNIESVNINDLDSNYLTQIVLYHNKISNFSISNINSHYDVQIYLDNNEITYLNIFRVNRIQILSVKKNQIKVIHREIFQNSRLTLLKLDLSYNALDNDVWNVLEGVTSLRALYLQHNKLQTVSPSVINRLSQLYYLDLSHNNIKSLTDVLLRSGKITNVLFNSNKLVNFPPNLIHDTDTFKDNPYCKLDISNNMLDNIHLSMPTTCSRLTLSLDQNELTAIHFNTYDKEIESLNISSNRLVTLPDTLLKAKRYIISNNPLLTTNVLKHLTTTMKDATQIEMDGINFLCNISDHYDFSNLKFPNVEILSIRRNCIPLKFLCHIGKSNINLYLDNNKNSLNSTEDIPCKMYNKDFGVVSFSGSKMSEIFVALFMKKYTNTIVNVSSLFFKKSQLEELPFIRYASLYNHGNRVFDFSDNFLKAFNGLEYTASDSFTLNLENNRITRFEKVTWKTNEDVLYRSINLKYMHNYLARIDGDFTLIEFIGNFPYVYISIDLSLNGLHTFDLASVINSNNDDLYVMVQNLNMSHNDLTDYRGCVPKSGRVRKLDYTYNKFRELPENSCQYADETYLGHNSISEISKTLPTVYIITLDLEWNLIKNIYENAFANMTSLRTLNLRGNALTTFPKAVQKLRNLRTLDISYNKLSNIKQSDISGKMNYLTSLVLTGNNLVPHLSTSFDLFGPIPGLELNDNLIYCDCGVLFLRNNTLNTHGRCSFPPEFEGYLLTCFPPDNCVGNVLIYVYKETKSRCLYDEYFDIKMSLFVVDGILSVRWKRLGPNKQTRMQVIAYHEQTIVKQILMNKTSQTNAFFVPHSLKTDHLCIYAFLRYRTFERCVDVDNEIKSTVRPKSVSETNSNNGAVYGTSAVLVLSVLLNIIVSICIIWLNRRIRVKKALNSNRLINNGYMPNEYEMVSVRRGDSDHQLEVYNVLTENINRTIDGAYANLNI